MANSSTDQNHVASLTAALNTTGQSVVVIQADVATHGLKVNDGTSGSDNGPANALHDQNHRPTLLAVSSADGVTPVVVYADTSGNLLVKST